MWENNNEIEANYYLIELLLEKWMESENRNSNPGFICALIGEKLRNMEEEYD